MTACDLFVLNSTHEGFPHVLLEAMGTGLPVVATEVGGTPELVSLRVLFASSCLVQKKDKG